MPNLCPVKARARRQKYYERGREAQLARNAQWKADNPDYAKEWYQRNKETIAIKTKLRRAKIQQFIQSEKLRLGCAECGYNSHHAALHWHHPNDDKKSAVAMCFSMKAAIEEMAKCIVLCANCHAVHHWQEKPDTVLETLAKSDELIALELAGVSIL